MENNSESKIVAAKRIAVVILLGAVGSGVWAGVGEPLFNVIGNAAVRAVSWFSSAYLESMYAEVGKGLYERSAFSLHSSISGLFLGFWVIIPFHMYSRRKSLTNKVSAIRIKLKAIEDGIPVPSPHEEEAPEQVLAEAERFAQKLTLFFWVVAVLSPLAATFQIAALYKNSYTSDAIVFVERSIEILAPHIEHESILKLRASYRAVSNRSQFVALHEELRSHAKAKNVELPTFSPL